MTTLSLVQIMASLLIVLAVSWFIVLPFFDSSATDRERAKEMPHQDQEGTGR